MFTNIKTELIYLVLAAIVVAAAVLRIYKITEIPPSLSWDEAAVGYNAFSIANYGMDEWGVRFPLVFKSFEDFKHPVHIYTTALFVKLFGLSDLTVRLPAAVFGVFNVILVFFLARILFKSDLAAVMAALILAVSPYNLQFSRFNHELNFTLFWFMLGLVLFYQGLRKKNSWLAFSFVSFGISLLSYHSAKIVVPPVILLLVILYFRRLMAFKKVFFVSLGILAVFVLMILMNTELLGLARLKQTSLQGSYLEKISLTARQYALHFKPRYLFLSGDKNARHSIQSVGEFYKAEIPFLILGAIFLLKRIIRKRSKEGLVLLGWALLAPLPAAAVSEAPHAARAMFSTGSWHLVIALGLAGALNLVRKPVFKISVLGIYLIFLAISFKEYLIEYYTEYATKYAVEWQYGMREAVRFVGQTKSVQEVYMTNIRQQPYIFVLYHLKYPLPKFLENVKYNNSPTRSFSTVTSFGKYHFLNEPDFAYMPAVYGVYYIVTPSEYDGLASKEEFAVAKLIKYPDGSDAFYIVTAK